MIKNRVLLVGGNGFIGKNLAYELIRNGNNVCIFDLNIPTNISEIITGIQYVQGSVHDINILIQLAKNSDIIVWLFHASVPATSALELEKEYIENVIPLIRFARIIVEHEMLVKFIYFSSGGTIYGDTNTNEPIKEEQICKPISGYGLTKLLAEENLTFIFKKTTVKLIILRPSNVYGRHQNLQKPQGIIGHAFLSVLKTRTLDVWGDGMVIRDYIHVSDLAKAVYLIIQNESKYLQSILNIGSGLPVSVNEILDLIASIVKTPVLVKRKESRSYDLNYNVLNIEKAVAEINWRPIVSLNEGLNDVWTWIKEAK